MERFLSYDRLIAHHRNKLDVKEFPQDKLNIAYLDNKYNQFLLHMNGDDDGIDLEIIKRVLREIDNQLQVGDEVFKYSIENPDLLDKVFEFLVDFHEDKEAEIEAKDADEIRCLAAQCFKQFCKVLTVKEHLHEERYIRDIHKTFTDNSEEVKIYVYQGLIFFAQSRYGIDILLKNDILKSIIARYIEEKSYEVINLILMLSNEILAAKGAPQIALECGMINNLKPLLKVEEVVEYAILNYGSLSLCEDGKKACVEEGSLIKGIMYYLDDFSNLNVLAACTRFLNSASILKRGKVEIYENKGVDMVMRLLDNFSNEQLVINCLQLIANVAEEPRGRKRLLDKYLRDVEYYLNEKNKFIVNQARITSDIITWKP